MLHLIEDRKPQKLYTLRQAAALLGMPYRQILEACKAGQIPHYKIQKSRNMVLLSEVMEFIKVTTKNGDCNE